jgi:hypothetical protein
MLAEMLLPALSKAKLRAQMTFDLNNNKQIMLAMHMYATLGLIDGSSQRMRTNDFYALAGGRVTDLSNGGTKWKNLLAGALPNRLWWHPNNNGHPNN